MVQILSDLTNNPYVGIAVVGVVLAATIFLRLYMIKHPGMMRAKCQKCGAVFDASHSFSGIHIGPIKQLRCPSCSKSSFMNTYVKNPINYPPNEPRQQGTSSLTDEELENKRIEDSKYEKP